MTYGAATMNKPERFFYRYGPLLSFIAYFAGIWMPIPSNIKGWLTFAIFPGLCVYWVIYFGRRKFQVRTTWYYLGLVWITCLFLIAGGHTIVFNFLELTESQRKTVYPYVCKLPWILAAAIVIYRLHIKKKGKNR